MQKFQAYEGIDGKEVEIILDRELTSLRRER